MYTFRWYNILRLYEYEFVSKSRTNCCMPWIVERKPSPTGRTYIVDLQTNVVISEAAVSISLQRDGESFTKRSNTLYSLMRISIIHHDETACESNMQASTEIGS
jgi:hypothetical protein